MLIYQLKILIFLIQFINLFHYFHYPALIEKALIFATQHANLMSRKLSKVENRVLKLSFCLPTLQNVKKLYKILFLLLVYCAMIQDSISKYEKLESKANTIYKLLYEL